MLPFAPPAEAEAYESTDGRITVWFPERGVAAARCVGFITGELARRAYALTDTQPVIPYEGFLDMVETSGFDWEARGRALKWNILHLSPKMHLHIIASTAPMHLAMRVFRKALGDHVELHTDPGTFASAYNLAVKRHARARPSEAPRR